jgi:hypothetical protein
MLMDTLTLCGKPWGPKSRETRNDPEKGALTAP